MPNAPLILGLESSCDETAAAVVRGQAVLSSVVATQHELHERYGGVVPEIASRAHLERLTPVMRGALDEAGVRVEEIEAIAVGNRPGLIGSLVVGVSAAQALAWSLGVPLVPVDHVRAHLTAAALHLAGDPKPEPVTYPALGLVVSGGHTTLYQLDHTQTLTRLGGTIDDAVGEAFDKAAAMLKAGYPGGPKLEALAAKGDPTAHRDLPRPMLDKAGEPDAPPSLDFSFSGLKTALLYKVRGKPVGRGKEAHFERDAEDLSEQARADLAASFQQALLDTLAKKIERAHQRMALEGVEPRSLVVGGGVTANQALRARLLELAGALGLSLHIPAMTFCVDNAAMIAGLAGMHQRQADRDGLDIGVMSTTR